MQPISIQYGVDFSAASQLSQGNEATGVAPASDVERFENLMQGPGAEPSKANDILGTGPAAHAAGNTLGDKVLDGMQGLKSGYDSQLEKIQTSLSDVNPMSTKEMFQLQVDLAKLTLQGELINKTVTKSTQNLDTLLKSQ